MKMYLLLDIYTKKIIAQSNDEGEMDRHPEPGMIVKRERYLEAITMERCPDCPKCCPTCKGAGLVKRKRRLKRYPG